MAFFHSSRGLRRIIVALLLACSGAAAAAQELEHPFPRRQPAPDFKAEREWFNTEKPLTLRELRGKFVLLDFWTYCCINCMHILPELAKLEEAFPNELVVIGVHSAKFAEEKLGDNIREAMLRHRIRHPVVNDSDHAIWSSYEVDTWPSLRLIDPEGNLVASQSGEVEFETLQRFLAAAIPYYRQQRTLDATPLTFRLEQLAAPGPLRFPGKLLFDEAAGRLFVADSGHDRIVVAKVAVADGRATAALEHTIGTGRTGAEDGSFATASFNQPQGMALGGGGQMLWIADTDNHLLRRAQLDAQTVETVAGTGRQGRGPVVGMQPPKTTPLNSPWDLWRHGSQLYIAMAGPHQIWRMPVDASRIGPYAGNGREDIVDGPLLPRQPYALGASSFAQPSGLASDGSWLYVADSEGSSIRAVPLPARAGDDVPFAPPPASRRVRTVVGTSRLPNRRLFTFGDVDGDASSARLQHPLGVAWHDDTLFVADTYNNKVKAVQLPAGTVRTLAGTGRRGRGDEPPEFDEPAGIAFGGGLLWIADTNNHAIRTVDPRTGVTHTLAIAGLEPPRPAGEGDANPAGPPVALFGMADDITVGDVRVAPTGDAGSRVVRLPISVEPAPGWKLNDLTPLRWKLTVDGAAGPLDAARMAAVSGKEAIARRDKAAPHAFEIAVPLAADTGTARLVLAIDGVLCAEAGTTCQPSAARATITIALDAEARPTPIRVPLR
jgi:thiol-disulfide isomerase/thioredoxin